MRERARRLGETLRCEQGAAAAVRLVEDYVRMGATTGIARGEMMGSVP
jgi:hypothetical protein